MNGKILTTKLKTSDIVKQVCIDFTYEFKDTYEFTKHHIDKSMLPEKYNIGLIIGSSGSGKSLLLNDFGSEEYYEWKKDDAICSHFADYDEAVKKLMGAGFNSIPMWLAPFDILSTGQKYRVNVAKTIKSNSVFDEFTSVIDRGTALGLSNSIQKLIRDENYENVVFASVHKDIIPYLKPDWVYNTDDKTLTINSETYNMENLERVQFVKKQHFMEIL
jgi:ABC-type lipoprotein export system ATPase subunit